MQVLGKEGKEIMRKPIPQAWMAEFVKQWDANGPAQKADLCLCGLAPSQILLTGGREAGDEYVERMMVKPDEMQWVETQQFEAQANDILSLVMLFPNPTNQDSLIEMQKWLHDNDLMTFKDKTQIASGHKEDTVCCKHVQVPGIGPE